MFRNLIKKEYFKALKTKVYIEKEKKQLKRQQPIFNVKNKNA